MNSSIVVDTQMHPTLPGKMILKLECGHVSIWDDSVQRFPGVAGCMAGCELCPNDVDMPEPDFERFP